MRIYLPRDHIQPGILEATEHHTTCPYKGEASYYTIKTLTATGEPFIDPMTGQPVVEMKMTQVGTNNAVAEMDVDIEVTSIPDALTVPVEAVLTRGATKSVFLLGSDDVVHARTVTIGASTDTAAQILTGLTAGDTVVTTGASALSDGQRVRTR